MYDTSVIVSAAMGEESLRSAVQTILRAPWAQRMEIVIVAEENVMAEAKLMCDMECSPHTIRVVQNKFQPGRTGARRTGILASTASVVAFYDDTTNQELNRARALLRHHAYNLPMREAHAGSYTNAEAAAKPRQTQGGS
ncbi:hypothetical protein ACXR2T_14845 [Leucobacter sp. HY1910]